MYISQGRLCVCLSLAAFLHYCRDSDVSWGNGKGCPLVVHRWVDLQLVHGLHCYDNIASNANCQQVIVFTLCLVFSIGSLLFYKRQVAARKQSENKKQNGKYLTLNKTATNY